MLLSGLQFGLVSSLGSVGFAWYVSFAVRKVEAALQSTQHRFLGSGEANH